MSPIISFLGSIDELMKKKLTKTSNGNRKITENSIYFIFFSNFFFRWFFLRSPWIFADYLSMFTTFRRLCTRVCILLRPRSLVTTARELSRDCSLLIYEGKAVNLSRLCAIRVNAVVRVIIQRATIKCGLFGFIVQRLITWNLADAAERFHWLLFIFEICYSFIELFVQAQSAVTGVKIFFVILVQNFPKS